MEILGEFHEKARHKQKSVLPTEKRLVEKYIQLEDGRYVPILRGGMVEASLEKFGGRLVDVKPASTAGLN